MKVLVVGASGATGRLLVERLLARHCDVRAVVRAADRLPKALADHDRLSLVEASVTAMHDAELAMLVDDCDAVASCLGHNLTLRGVFGAPRRLVTDTTRRLCNALAARNPTVPVRFVLMNSAGNSNRNQAEPVSQGHRAVIGLLRYLVPPHADNEQAAEVLRVEVGQHSSSVEWVVVRPDALTDDARATRYILRVSPTRSAIFDPGKTSRINVAHFMAELLTNDAVWQRWHGNMPVIYNAGNP